MDNNINNINGTDTSSIVATPVATVATSTTATPATAILPPVPPLDIPKVDIAQSSPSSKVRLIALIVVLVLLAAIAGATYMYKDKISDLFTSSSGESETAIKVNTNVDVNKDTEKSVPIADKTVAIVDAEATNTVSVMSKATTSIATSSLMSTTTKSTSTIVKGYTSSIIIKHAKVTVTINDEVFVDKDSSDTFTSIASRLVNLKKGNNKVVVTYTKSTDDDTDMAVIMEVKRYSKIVLTLSPKNNKLQDGILEGNIMAP